MNVIFQALVYVPSVREYSENQYLQLSSESATEKVVDLFQAMYTGKYNFMLMGGIVNEFERSDPLTFLKKGLADASDEGFFEGFFIIKVSLPTWKTINVVITFL